MKLCDRCKVSECSLSGCSLNYLGEDCERTRERECPEIQPNNAEIIQNFSMEELANFLEIVNKDIAPENMLEWLKQSTLK